MVLKIGAFAKRTAVSVKTLRFYDQAGVLRPACIDASSRYRYYRLDQLGILRELRQLRELGASIEDLRAWVAAGDSLSGRLTLLRRLRKELQNRLGRDRDRLQYIDHWIHCAPLWRKSTQLFRPTVRRILATPALTLRDQVNTAGLGVYRMFEFAEQTVARESARAAKRPFLLIHDGDYRVRRADVEVCIPILPSALSALRGRIVEGATRSVGLRFEGNYDRAPSVATALKNWVRATGARASGPLRESYIRFGADQRGYKLPPSCLAARDADYLTEIQLPIATE
ncbi:MAG: MerR family transcriptional regulator [Proteobacteria bacterium]|nr:MerR family transcriptional regulator [Pseudomonadota bacterium]